jgi:hypothetical protein
MSRDEYKIHAFAGYAHRTILIVASDSRDQITPRQHLIMTRKYRSQDRKIALCHLQKVVHRLDVKRCPDVAN